MVKIVKLIVFIIAIILIIAFFNMPSIGTIGGADFPTEMFIIKN